MSYTNEQQQWLADMQRKRELEKLRYLQQKYSVTPDYSNMSLQEELQARFDMDEMTQLQQKYGSTMQTPIQPMPITTPVPQIAQPTQSVFQQPSPPQQNSFLQNAYSNAKQMAENFANDVAGTGITFAQGLTGNNFDEMVGGIGAKIVTRLSNHDQTNTAAYNHAYSHIRDDIRAQHNNFKERYPTLGDVLEISGTIWNKISNPYALAVLYGTGSADNMDQIPAEIVSNALGNKYAKKIPTHILPKPLDEFAQEYFSRYIGDYLKNDK